MSPITFNQSKKHFKKFYLYKHKSLKTLILSHNK